METLIFFIGYQVTVHCKDTSSAEGQLLYVDTMGALLGLNNGDMHYFIKDYITDVYLSKETTNRVQATAAL